MENIKSIELLGEFKFNEIYYFYKTSSSETNLEILSQLKKYQSSMDFFSYYTNIDTRDCTKFFEELEQNLINIFDKESNKYSTNTEKYISKISKIILTLNLIQKNQRILNSIISKTKHYFSEIFTNYEHDIIYQEKLLFLINSLQYNYSNDFIPPKKNISRISTQNDSCSSRIISQESFQTTQKNINTDTNNNDSFENFFEKNKFSIINEECLSDICTPKFQINEKNIKEYQSKKSVKNSNIDTNLQKGSTLTLSEMIFAPCPEDKKNHSSNKKNKIKSNTNIKRKNRKNSFVPVRSNFKKLSENMSRHKSKLRKTIGSVEEVQMFSDLLILIKRLYKFCLITSEERIKLKKLVIEKSKPVLEFYCNEFKNNKTDYKKLADEIKKHFKMIE